MQGVCVYVYLMSVPPFLMCSTGNPLPPLPSVIIMRMDVVKIIIHLCQYQKSIKADHEKKKMKKREEKSEKPPPETINP